MNTTDLGELLRGATAGVEPSEGFTEQVLQGGRRRRFRRRIAMAASAVVVAAVAVAGTTVGWNDAAPSVGEQRLNTPTKGDLADDQAFLDGVTRVWQSELSLAAENRYRVYDDLRGEPHVVWAGNTPAGPAAIVIQQTQIHEDYWVQAKWSGEYLAEGLVAIDPEDGKLKLLGTRSPFQDGEPLSYYVFGPDDRTMLIVDMGKPLYYSTNPRVKTDGDDPYRPEWHRVSAHDGVAIVAIPEPSGDWGTHRLLAYHGDHPPSVVDGDTKEIAYPETSWGYLHGRITKVPDDQLPFPNFFRWEDTWTFGTPAGGVNANGVQFAVDDRIHSQWQVTVWLPDRVVVVKETMIDREPSRFDGNGSVLTVAISTIEPDAVGNVPVVDVERVDHDAVLPIKYRIPDGGGWVVAKKGQSLSYRTAPDGQWQDAGKDAALLPDNAVEVKVGEDVVRL